MGQGEENDRAGKAASCFLWSVALTGSWMLPALPLQHPLEQLLWTITLPLLGPDILLAAENSTEHYALQSTVFHECGANPMATNPTSCYSCDTQGTHKITGLGETTKIFESNPALKFNQTMAPNATSNIF